MQRNRIYILALLYKLLIIGPIYNNYNSYILKRGKSIKND